MNIRLTITAVALVTLLVVSIYLCNNRASSTVRIGNLVDAWYFGSLGSKQRQKEFNLIQKKCGNKSFGSYLRLDFSLRNHLGSSTLSNLVESSDKFWASYDYANIIQCIHEYHSALRAQMYTFATLHRPELLVPASYDCVIHFRIGDFLKLGLLIDPESVVEACVPMLPSYIGIMDGGMTHNTNEKIRRSSLKIKHDLKEMLKTRLPNAKVEDCTAGDVDSDFFTCANAPMLVTAGGSFAICAAVASEGQVRTPACKNINFCNEGSRSIQEIRPGWITFAYSNYEDTS